MKIVIASDHAGFSLKEVIKEHLSGNKELKMVDCGSFSDESVDYPEYGMKAAKEVAMRNADRAILVCGSGIGMCMVANKLPGIRAAVLRSEFDAEMSRLHNDSNIACFGARITSEEEALKLLDVWLKTEFEGGRHQRRVNKIG